MKETFTLTFENPDYEDKEIDVTPYFDTGKNILLPVIMKYGDKTKTFDFNTFFHMVSSICTNVSVLSSTDSRRIDFYGIEIVNMVANNTNPISRDRRNGDYLRKSADLFRLNGLLTFIIKMQPYERFEVVLENKSPNIPFFSGLYK